MKEMKATKYSVILIIVFMIFGCKDPITINEVKSALKVGNMVRCSGKFSMEDFGADDKIFFEDGQLSKKGISLSYDLDECRIIESL